MHFLSRSASTCAGRSDDREFEGFKERDPEAQYRLTERKWSVIYSTPACIARTFIISFLRAWFR